MRWIILVMLLPGWMAMAEVPPQPEDDQVLWVLPHDWQDYKAAIRASNTLNLQELKQHIKQLVANAKQTQDGRKLGYAGSLLTKALQRRPNDTELLYHEADLSQYRHDFDTAIELLDRLLAMDPAHVQARLARANIHTIQARYDLALQDCRQLAGQIHQLWLTSCISQIRGRQGHLQDSYALLKRVFEAQLPMPDHQAYWPVSLLLEMAHRLNRPAEVKAWLKRLLGDGQSPPAPKTWGLIQAYFHPDLCGQLQPLWPRVTWHPTVRLVAYRCGEQVSAQRQALEDYVTRVKQRRDGGERRLLAGIYFYVFNETQQALDTALANWQTQKEPEDLLLLLQLAGAANNTFIPARIKTWMKSHEFEYEGLGKKRI